jgi:hypothetical protein
LIGAECTAGDEGADPETAAMLAEDDVEAGEWLTSSIGAWGKAQQMITKKKRLGIDLH